MLDVVGHDRLCLGGVVVGELDVYDVQLGGVEDVFGV